jgi:hypothetical protein
MGILTTVNFCTYLCPASLTKLVPGLSNYNMDNLIKLITLV